MKLNINQLEKSFANGLKPVYLLHGDEPLLVHEGVQQIIEQAKQQGFDEVTHLQASPQFKWPELTEQSNTLSLFSEKKLLKLTMPTGKPGKIGGQVIQDVIATLTADQLLVIICNKLESNTYKTAWYKAIEKHGIVVQIWPLQNRELINWITTRLAKYSFKTEPGVIDLLIENTAGNLLATSQEIEKLFLLYGQETTITLKQAHEAITDRAHYTIFDLVDAWLHSNAKLYLRILSALKAQGITEILVLWALTREIRQLATAANIMQQQTLEQAQRHLPAFRKTVLSRHLQQHTVDDYYNLLQICASVELAIKGLGEQSPWFLLQQMIAKPYSTMLS
jgi:DNA polymerase-3 subunit delta